MATEPVIRLSVFRNSTTTISFALTFIHGMVVGHPSRVSVFLEADGATAVEPALLPPALL